jgi:RNA polymerase sigma-70 factor (ECF subfamily)
LRFIGNETVADDLLSDVFLDVWQRTGRFEGRAAVTTWLLSIVYPGRVLTGRMTQQAAD